MKQFLISFIFIISSIVANSQSTNISTFLLESKKKADRLYDQMAYRNSLHLYLRMIDKDSLDIHARERAASCYIRLSDPVHAEVWLATLALEKDCKLETLYQYAEVLSMNRKYPEAKIWFAKYLEAKPNDNRAKEKIIFLDQLHDYMNDSIRFGVGSANFNSVQSDFGATYYKNGLVFSSTRDQEVFIKKQSVDAHNNVETLLNLYYVEKNNIGDYGAVVPLKDANFKTDLHDGSVIFYQNGTKAIFTRNNGGSRKERQATNGKVNLSIFFADVESPLQLKNITSFDFNNPECSSAHPTISKDGSIMFFSSDLKSGLGGSDLYYSKKEDRFWQRPVNLGSNINTEGDELFPYLANDTTLFFSSNGHGSLGGLDIMVAYIRKNNTLSKPYNFGATLNSSYDDFSIITDSTGRIGHFSSNRPGGQGLDDVYFFVANGYYLAGEVRELSAEQLKIPDLKISVYNSNGDLMDSVRSDENGNFRLNLPLDHDFLIRGEKEGYESLEDLKFSTRGKPFGVDSIMLPVWKYQLFAKGRIFSNESQAPLQGVTVILKNLSDNKIDSMVVNENGEYKFLVRPNKKYEVLATKKGFIPSGFKLDSKNLYKGDLLNDIVLEEVFIEKELAFFDYGGSTLTAQSLKQLNRIVRTLKGLPKSTLNVGAHADSRGSEQYNKLLSDRRAEAVVKYIVSQGIARKRIEAIGFGEELILNQCSDGVECPEDEHSKNRRAEIKVQRDKVD